MRLEILSPRRAPALYCFCAPPPPVPRSALSRRESGNGGRQRRGRKNKFSFALVVARCAELDFIRFYGAAFVARTSARALASELEREESRLFSESRACERDACNYTDGGFALSHAGDVSFCFRLRYGSIGFLIRFIGLSVYLYNTRVCFRRINIRARDRKYVR